MRIARVSMLCLGLVHSLFAPGLATEVMPWLTPTSIGGANLEVYYANSTQEVKLDIGYKVPCDYVSERVNLKCTFRPGLGVELYGLVGITGSELKNDKLCRGQMDGTVFGGGIRYVLLGDIIILPAVSFELALNHSSSSLTEEDGSKIDLGLDSTELQGSVMASKKIGIATPYGGVKFFHNWVRWKDEAKGDKGKGSSGDISPFLGTKISFSPLLSIKGEISFLDEFTYAGGLNLSLAL